MEKISCIYKITNLINNKIYVGQTKDYKRRLSEYKNKSKKINKHTNYEIMKVIHDYGIENFSFEILEYCSIEELDEKEIFWIKKLKSRNSKFGYNSKTGGGSKGKMTKKSKDKMSKSSKNFRHTEEEKLRRSIKIIVYDTLTNKIWKEQSAKIFSDKIHTERTVVTKSIRRGQKLYNYYIFYDNKSLRDCQYEKIICERSKNSISKNLKEYMKIYRLISENQGVETKFPKG